MADRPAHQAWYTTCARNFDCNDHPRQPKDLALMVSEFTGISEGNASHILDRLLHLHTCLGEPENLTLFRLQPGKKQTPAPADTWDD